MKTAKSAGAKSAKTVKQTAAIEAFAGWSTRIKAPDDKPFPIGERLWKFSERTHCGMPSPAEMRFEARTRLDNERVIETLFFHPERQAFYLKRNEVQSDGSWGESYGELTTQEAILWSVDRLLGPATFQAIKRFVKPVINERKAVASKRVVKAVGR